MVLMLNFGPQAFSRMPDPSVELRALPTRLARLSAITDLTTVQLAEPRKTKNKVERSGLEAKP